MYTAWSREAKTEIPVHIYWRRMSMSTNELQNDLIERMRSWQKIEDAAVLQTSKVISKTENPLIRTVMEIINRDSMMHNRVQGMIADSIEKSAVSISYDDLSAVWDDVESHIQTEIKMHSAAQKTLEAIKGKNMIVAEYLLNYLVIDENKHNALLDALEGIKKAMNPT
jgi:hypothetical protein